MISRRGFLGILGAALAHEAVKPIYVFAPPQGWGVGNSGLFTPGEAMFFLPEKDWKYRYTYRNVVIGHVSDATPEVARLVHTFAYPELDMVDIYKQMTDGSFDYERTLGAMIDG